MPYDPQSRGNRTYLALALKSMLTEAGFIKADPAEISAELRANTAKKKDYAKSKGNTRRARRSRYSFAEPIEIKEEVWERSTPNPRMIIRVYTTIVNNQVRGEGKDAIRVNLLWKIGTESQALDTEKRVNRTGNISEIIKRTRDRMRNAYTMGAKLERCHCGAPKFESKAKNKVCADLCWIKKG